MPEIGKQEREVASERCNCQYSFLNAVSNLENFSESETREFRSWNDAEKELSAVMDLPNDSAMVASTLNNTTTEI